MLFEQKKLRLQLQNLSADLADANHERALVRSEIAQVREANRTLELANIRLLAERDGAIAERNNAVAGGNEARIERDKIVADKIALREAFEEAVRERDQAMADKSALRNRFEEAVRERDQAMVDKSALRNRFEEAVRDRDQSLADKISLTAMYEDAVRERDQAVADKISLTAMYQDAVRERDQAVADKISLTAMYQDAVRERDAIAAQLTEAGADNRNFADKIGVLEQELAKAIQGHADLDQLYKASLVDHGRVAEQVAHSLNALQASSAQNACHVRTPYYYLGNGRALTHLSTGQPFFVATNDQAITPWLLMGGTHETFADDIVTSYVVPGMSVVDVGANMGYYSVKWGTRIGPDGVLHAFEPNPDVLDLLRANVTINGLQFRCHVHAIGAGSKRSRGKLTFQHTNLGLAGFDQPDVPDRTYDVAIDTVDNVLPSLERVDLFKIDTEGYEPEVLAGAAKLIGRSPNCAFQIEMQPSWDRFGRTDSILGPIIAGRRLFVICHNKTLMPINLVQLSGYVRQTPHKMADLFICPEADEYVGRVSKFIVEKYIAPKFGAGPRVGQPSTCARKAPSRKPPRKKS